MIVISMVLVTLVYFGVNIYLVLLRNYQAHRFFKTKCPQLPVVPNASIWSGNMYQVTRPAKNWKIIEELHLKYGPTFGYYMCDQAWVSTKDVDLLKLIEMDKGHRHINRSKFGLPFKEFNDSIFQVDDDNWRRIRRAITPALTNHKVRSDEISDDISSIIGELSQALEEKINKAEAERGERWVIINAHDAFLRYSLAVVFLITYKKDKMIDFRADHDHWVRVVEKGARDITNPLVDVSLMFPFARPLCQFIAKFHSVGKLQDQIIDYVAEASDINRVAREVHAKIQRRLSVETGARERDFYELKRQGNFKRRLVDTLIDAFIEKKISHEDFIGSTLFLLLAGFMTTADTITCLIWHLAREPEVQERLRKAIVEEGIDAEFVVWCIMETVRWHPAVPLGTGRILGEDVNVNGLSLPKGVFVMPSTHSIHHDPSIWPEPHLFKPDRWRHASDFHPAAFMGFGLGPRNCAGGKLAVHEIKLVLGMLLTQYRIESCSETCAEYDFSAPGLIYTLLDQPVKVRLVALDAKVQAKARSP